MKNRLTYTFEEDLKKRLKRPGFRKIWEESEQKYLLAKQLIEDLESIRRIKEGKCQPAAGVLLLKLAQLKGKGPRDFAQRHDAYGWESPTHR